MRAYLHNLKRTLALAASIAITAAFFSVAGDAPARYITVDGKQYQQQRAELTLLAQLAIMVVSALLSYALAPKPPRPKPAGLAEFDIPQSKEGQPFSWIFGECYVPDATVAYWGNLTNTPIKAKGGKK